MTFAQTLAGAILASVTLAAGAAQQPALEASSFKGIVRDATGTPVACARVVLRGAAQILSMRTGADGRFSFERVPFRARWLGVDESSMLDARRYDTQREINLTTATDALLAGVLLDERHQPAAHVKVTALRREQKYGRLRFVPVTNDVTEADGSYCLRVDLAGTANEFLVGVIPAGTWVSGPVWAEHVTRLHGLPPTYFPSVTSTAAAQAVRLSTGEFRTNLNFAIQAGRVTRIEGDLLNPDPLILSQSDVVLEPPDEDVAIYRRATPDARGHFVFDDVVPGTYTVRVFPIFRSEGAGKWGVASVTVRGEPRTHVAVQLQPTQTFAGSISFAGAPSVLPGVRLLVTVVADRVQDPEQRFPGEFYPSVLAIPSASGTFTMQNMVPGEYRVFVSDISWRGWRLDTITVPVIDDDGVVESRDITATPLIVEAGRDTFGAAVRMKAIVPRITGTVRGADGRPSTARVMVFPVDQELWTGPRASTHQAEVTSQPDGTFNIYTLDAGEYFVVAVRPSPTPGSATFKALQAIATRVMVGRDEEPSATVSLLEQPWNPGRDK